MPRQRALGNLSFRQQDKQKRRPSAYRRCREPGHVGRQKERGSGGRDVVGAGSLSCGQGPSVPFDTHGDTHAAADTQGRKALAGVAALHFVKQGHENPCARCADRMPESNRPAIDIDLFRIEAQRAIDRAGLRGESFIGFDKIELVNGPARPLQRLSAKRSPARSP